MAVGLGIHGEPGIDETDMPTADGLAELLVSRLLDEVPEGVDVAGARVVPILNGLGSVKYEEMFVVYRRIAELLRAAGVEVVDPHVGEFCTSFDMAGALADPASGSNGGSSSACGPHPSTPRPTGAARSPTASGPTSEPPRPRERTIPPADDGVAAAATLVAALRPGRPRRSTSRPTSSAGSTRSPATATTASACSAAAAARAAAARAAAQAGAGAGTTLAEAGDAWSDQGGGTSGVIWGRMLHTLGQAFGDDARVDAGAVPARCLAARHDRRRAGRPGHRATGGPAGAGPVARRQEHRHPRPRRGVLRPRVRDGGRGTGPRGDRLILALRERAVVECGPAMVSCSSSTTPRATRQRLAPLVARRPPAARPVHTPRSGRTCPSVNLTRLVRLTLRGRCRPGGRGWNLAVGGGGCR